MNITLLKSLFSGTIKQLARQYAAEGRPLNVTLDIVFKSLFVGDDEDSREARRYLLSDCLHRPPVS
jgi:hypothetical protein